MKALEDLLRPVEDMISDLVESGWIWAVIAGIVIIVCYVIIRSWFI